MLKLKLQYVVHLMRRADSLEKTLMLAWDDPLEKEMANCSSILAWKFPWAEETGGLHSMRPQMLDMTEHACKDSNNPSYVINPGKNGIHQNFRLVNMWRCCDGSIPGEPCASLSSDYS